MSIDQLSLTKQGIAFLATWVPYASVSLAEGFGLRVGIVVPALACVWTKNCVCTDPIIYFWCNTKVYSPVVS